jgi:ferrochelatase
MGMRYGNPPLSDALIKLQNKGCNKIITLPLYPQYSCTTSLSTYEAIHSELNAWENNPELIFVDHYYQNDDYIKSLVNSVNEHQTQHGKPDCLLISFHGIPQRFIDEGDVYYEHCFNTAELLAKALNLKSNQYKLCFQSIFGREEWVKPHTKSCLESLANEGVSHVQVICPGFSADCLETLEEIDVENRGYYLAAGGKLFSYIPALNDRIEHIEALSSIIEKHI